MAQITDPQKYNKLSNVELNEIWKQVKNHIVTNNDHNHPNCIVTNYVPSNNRRPQIRYKGEKYYISIVLCLRKNRKIDLNYSIKVGHECSHLCHNTSCINEHCLTFENGEINKSRSCCKIFKDVNGYYCPHDPICPGCSGITGWNVFEND